VGASVDQLGQAGRGVTQRAAVDVSGALPGFTNNGLGLPPAASGRLLQGGRLAVSIVSARDAARLRAAAAPDGVKPAGARMRGRELSGFASGGQRSDARSLAARAKPSATELSAFSATATRAHALDAVAPAQVRARSAQIGIGGGRVAVASRTGGQAPAAALFRRRNVDVLPGTHGAMGAMTAGIKSDAGQSVSGVTGGAISSSGGTTGGSGGPEQGDVYLDGTLMGRWMSRALAKEAARPPAGGAAFDGRRNPLPTGRMIGG
jgi:hypothetical protein